jgi:hypothetical protein
MRLTPSWDSSSATIAALGQPMPVDWTEIGCPSKVPVKPSIPRSWLTWRGLSKNVSAMYWARRGSPGKRTAGA